MPILIICLLFTPALLQAREIGQGAVRAAVETWVRQVTADARPDAVIERMEPYRVNGQTVAYIAHLLGGGFCLCGADDLVLPVYLYSPEEAYDPQNPSYEYFLWEIETRTRFLRQGIAEDDPRVLRHQENLTDRAAFWQNLIAGRAPSRVKEKTEPMQMELDLTCTWSQGSPYNDQCPELTPGEDEHCKVGCVATAMSQIMYYWKRPHTGQDDGYVYYEHRWRSTWDEEPLADDPNIPPYSDWVDRLEWTADDGGQLRMNGYWDQSIYNEAAEISVDVDYQNALETLWDNLTVDSTYCYANFGATTYDWSLMEDDHTDPPDAGDDEAAKLCYHVGVALDMNYHVNSSSAQSSDIETALEDHFHYDQDATYGTRDIDTMVEEIQWLRPLHLRGTKNPKELDHGHAWMVLGYNKGTDPDRQFLMNMGWGGSAAWCTIDNVPQDLSLIHI